MSQSAECAPRMRHAGLTSHCVCFRLRLCGLPWRTLRPLAWRRRRLRLSAIVESSVNCWTVCVPVRGVEEVKSLQAENESGKRREQCPCRWTLHYHMIGIQLPSPVSAGAPGRDPSVRGEVLHATREARVRAREGGRARETESQSERYTRRPRDHQVRARIRLRERASIVAAGL